MSAPRRRPPRGTRSDLPVRRRSRRRSPASAAARCRARDRRRPHGGCVCGGGRCLHVRLVVRSLVAAGGAGSGRTRSSTPPTARCSARSRPSATARSCRSRASAPWMPKATVAIEDRRFYTHGGIDPQGIARAVVADAKARSVVQGGSTITQQLVRNLYISNERTVQRKLKEACLALKLNDAWSKEQDPGELPQPGLLRQPRVRDRGSGADVLLEAGADAESPRVGAARRADAGAVGVRPVRRADEGTLAPQCGSRRDAGSGRDHGEAVPLGAGVERPSPQARPPLQGDQRAVLLRVRPRSADPNLRHGDRALGRAERLHDDPPALAACRTGRDPRDAHRAGRPGGGGDLDRSRERRHPRDDRRRARP